LPWIFSGFYRREEEAGEFRKTSGDRRLRRRLTGFECSEIQSDLMQEIEFGRGE
jgi:hypothetical protein